MEKNNTILAKPVSRNIYRVAYGAFVIAGLVFMFAKHDFSNAVIYWGLALAFDPFDQAVPFYKRPVWQQALLVAHLLVVLTLFVLMIIQH